ncbi:Acg family FMN-binding oxidoreductase [Nocardia sp. NPDC051750]|uniref:Acg family FMN-binding oxidoreductase n=1 Tax=Nocardia sp. NPDC051750 TaxID=3364325 RepID=UPI00379A5D2E
MHSAIPDREATDIALGYAVRAPSVHNTQPWRWRPAPTGLQLFADTSRQLPATDPFQRALIISCGAALHHLRLGLATLNWSTSVDYCPDPADPAHLATVHTTRQRPTDAQIEQAAAILLRRTDRRRYLSRPIPARHIRSLAGRVSDFGAAVRQVPDPMLPRLAGPMRHAATLHSGDQEYQAEIARWSGPGRTCDGVPSRNAPAPRQAGEIPVRSFAEPTLLDPADHPDGAQWLVVGTPRDDRRAQLRAGEAISALLLTATSLGLATSLQTEPLGMLESRQEIRTQLLHDCAYPQAMVRVGWSAGHAAPLPETPRRPVREVVEV